MHNMLPLKKVPQERQTGFTLVEALIAMLILVVAIVGWMGAQDASVSNRGLSRTMTVATELVQSKMEELAEDPETYCSTTGCEDIEEQTVNDGFEYTLVWSMYREELSNSGVALEHALPLWVIVVEGKWNHRGPKSTGEFRRVVMQ